MKNTIPLKGSLLFLWLTGLMLSLNINIAYGQPNNPTFDQNPIPPSPEAQAFMKYGIYPVDYSTGVPKVEIPIYEIKSGKLSLPISLSYHASGIKINELAGSSGLGWSLNAGGAVSRVINGIEDENGFLQYDHYSASYIDNYAPPSGGDYINVYQYVAAIAFGNNSGDGRSDDYFYNVGSGLSGQFVYDINKTLHQRSFSNNVINWTGATQNTFEIIGEDGTHYIFNDKELVHTARSSCPSSWYVSKIISSDGKDEIDFEYNVFPGNAYFTESQTFNNNNTIVGDPTTQLKMEWHRNIVTSDNSVLIKRIKFKNGSVTFTYEGGRKDFMNNRLSAITINTINTAGTEVPLNSYQLVHTYFGDVNAPNPKFATRLRLDEIKRLDQNNQYINSYHFHYNQMTLPPMIDPNHPSGSTLSSPAFAQDYWGYYNGHLENRHLLPLIPTGEGDPANRSTDVTYMKAESLEKIDYPTGGSTTFEFEANGNPGPVGGLRVAKITSTASATAVPVVKQYQYGNPVSITPNGEQSYYVFLQKYDNGVAGNYGAFDCPTKAVYFSDPIVPSGSHHGSPVIYAAVEELMDDGQGQKQKTLYTYDAEADQAYSVPETGKYGNVTYSDKSWARGNLLSTTYYKFVNNNYVPVKNITNHYDPKQVSTINTGLNCFIQTLHSQNSEGRNNPGGYPLPYAYPAFRPAPHPRYYDFSYFDVNEEAGIKKITSTVETDYDDSGNPTTSKLTNNYYDSPDHLFLTQKDETNSDGTKYITQYKYPQDFRGLPPYDAMIGNNILSPAIQVFNYKNTVSNLLSFQKTNYADWGNNIIAPATIDLQKSSNPVQTVFNYLGYDEEGNVISTGRTAGPITSYQWGYQQQYPIVQIKNAANTLKTTATSVGNSFSIQFPAASRDVSTRQFTVGTNGTASLSIDFGGDEGSGTVRAEVSISVTGPNNYNSGSFSLCLATGTATCGNYSSSRVLTGLSPGNYTLSASIFDAQNLIVPVNLSVYYSGVVPVISGNKDFYYDGFEESGGNSANNDCRTGHLSHTGPYSVVLNNLSSRSYVLSYWVRSGNSWILQTSSPVSVTGGTYTISIPGGQIDDVRFCPVDAQMSTYTYDPLVGMTSVTDPKNETTTYEYDSLQRLKNVKDKDGNIIKQTTYHYQGQ
jgi:YD repeat-containing protein